MDIFNGPLKLSETLHVNALSKCCNYELWKQYCEVVSSLQTLYLLHYKTEYVHLTILVMALIILHSFSKLNYIYTNFLISGILQNLRSFYWWWRSFMVSCNNWPIHTRCIHLTRFCEHTINCKTRFLRGLE